MDSRITTNQFTYLTQNNQKPSITINRASLTNKKDEYISTNQPSFGSNSPLKVIQKGWTILASSIPFNLPSEISYNKLKNIKVNEGDKVFYKLLDKYQDSPNVVLHLMGSLDTFGEKCRFGQGADFGFNATLKVLEIARKFKKSRAENIFAQAGFQMNFLPENNRFEIFKNVFEYSLDNKNVKPLRELARHLWSLTNESFVEGFEKLTKVNKNVFKDKQLDINLRSVYKTITEDFGRKDIEKSLLEKGIKF